MCCIDCNLIYILICGGCDNFYIGECSIVASLRMNLHRDHAKVNPNISALPCDKHFRQCADGKFYIAFLYKMPYGSMLSARRTMEHKFINSLKPQLNE